MIHRSPYNKKDPATISGRIFIGSRLPRETGYCLAGFATSYCLALAVGTAT
jgi:hypothetical protein